MKRKAYRRSNHTKDCNSSRQSEMAVASTTCDVVGVTHCTNRRKRFSNASRRGALIDPSLNRTGQSLAPHPSRHTLNPKLKNDKDTINSCFRKVRAKTGAQRTRSVKGARESLTTNNQPLPKRQDPRRPPPDGPLSPPSTYLQRLPPILSSLLM